MWLGILEIASVSSQLVVQMRASLTNLHRRFLDIRIRQRYVETYEQSSSMAILETVLSSITGLGILQDVTEPCAR